jgi:hypothetical protein
MTSLDLFMEINNLVFVVFGARLGYDNYVVVMILINIVFEIEVF